MGAGSSREKGWSATMASLGRSMRGACACASNRVVAKMESAKKKQNAACPRRVGFHRKGPRSSMLKKEAARAPPRRIFTTCARENSARRDCRRDLARKSAFAKRCVSLWEKDPRIDTYIAKSADFAKSIHATVTTHECAVWVSLKTRNSQLKPRRNHRDLAPPDFIDRNLPRRHAPLSPIGLIKSRSTIRRPINMKKHLILTA